MIALSPDLIAFGGGGIVALKISLLAVGSELVGKTAIFKVRARQTIPH